MRHYTSSFPIYAPTFTREFRILGRENDSTEPNYADINRVTDGYLPMMGIPLSQGRQFTASDDAGSAGVAIIDETTQRRFFPNSNPVGQALDIDTDAGTRRTFTIIGVARRVINVGNQYELENPRPIVYVPYVQFPPTTMTLLARTEGPPGVLVPLLRNLLRRTDPELPVRDIRSLQERIDEAGGRNNQILGMMGMFAVWGLVLAGIGIFGVVSFSVERRTREIGIRMALGAQPSDVQGMFLRQGLRLAAMGICLGVGAALALTREIESLLYGVSPVDPPTYAGISLLVLIVALLACYLPARRAATVSPMQALRSE